MIINFYMFQFSYNFHLCNYTLMFFSFFLWLHLQHMEIPGLGIESELQLQTYTTAMVTLDPSPICHLHLSLQQCQILNPLQEARDWITSSWTLLRVLNPLNCNGNSIISFWRTIFCLKNVYGLCLWPPTGRTVLRGFSKSVPWVINLRLAQIKFFLHQL